MAARTHILRTRRLTLRPVAPGDADAIAAGIGNYDVARWLSVVPYPYGRADAERFIASKSAAPGTAWAICDSAGFRGLIAAEDELGFWLDRDAWGRGYLTEAGDAVVDAWFSRRRAGDLMSDHFAGNDRSARVLEKLGFVPDGAARRFARPLQQEVTATRLRLTRARWTERRRFHLTTPRLRLRPFRDGDALRLARIGGDARVAPMLSSVPLDWNAAAAGDWIAAARYRGRPGFRIAACLPSGRLVGAVGLGADHSLSVFLDPRHWGRGLGTEALGAFAAECEARFGLAYLRADHFTDNPASARMLAKLGFVAEGGATGTSRARLEPAPIVLYRRVASLAKALS